VDSTASCKVLNHFDLLPLEEALLEIPPFLNASNPSFGLADPARSNLKKVQLASSLVVGSSDVVVVVVVGVIEGSS